MALRYITSNYMRLTFTTVFKNDSITALLRQKSDIKNFPLSLSRLWSITERPLSTNVCSCFRVLGEARSQQHKYENLKSTKSQAGAPVKYEDWESVLKQGEVEQSEEEGEGDAPSVVYLGVLSSQIRRVKLLSFGTSAMGFCMQPILFSQTDTSVAATVAVFTMLSFFTYATPFLINLVAKRYVCEIVFDPKTNSYTATTYNFFLQKKQLTFQTPHVEVPEVPGPFTSFIINTPDGRCTPLFVAPNTFTKPRHYAKLMGYDKPINLHLKDDTTETKNVNDNLK